MPVVQQSGVTHQLAQDQPDLTSAKICLAKSVSPPMDSLRASSLRHDLLIPRARNLVMREFGIINLPALPHYPPGGSLSKIRVCATTRVKSVNRLVIDDRRLGEFFATKFA